METGKRNAQLEKDGKVIRVNLENADLSTLFTLRNKLLNMKLKGIPGITRVTVVQENDEWVIQTAGSNLAKVIADPRSRHQAGSPPTTSTRSPRSSGSRRRAPPSSGRSWARSTSRGSRST